MRVERDDEDERLALARFDRLVELLDVIRSNTREIHKIAADLREESRRRVEQARVLQAYRKQRAGKQR
jgi:hypothetical protein